MSKPTLLRIFYLGPFSAHESDLATVLNQVFKDYALAKVKKFLRLSHLYLCAYLSILENSATIFTLKKMSTSTHTICTRMQLASFLNPLAAISS